MGRSAPPSGPTGRGGGGGGGVARVGWAGWTTAGALVASTTGATDPVSTTPGAMESGVGLTRSPNVKIEKIRLLSRKKMLFLIIGKITFLYV